MRKRVETEGLQADSDGVVPIRLLLPSRVAAWLARHSTDDVEAAEMAVSMITMIVDDDEAAHETMH